MNPRNVYTTLRPEPLFRIKKDPCPRNAGLKVARNPQVVLTLLPGLIPLPKLSVTAHSLHHTPKVWTVCLISHVGSRLQMPLGLGGGRERGFRACDRGCSWG